MKPFICLSYLLTLGTLAGCGGRSADANPDPDAAATLQVENQGFSDMVIYAVDAGQRVRLGLVSGNSKQTFTIPRYLVGRAGPLRFLADPVGGNHTPVSEEMAVQPGDSVSLTIPP